MSDGTHTRRMSWLCPPLLDRPDRGVETVLFYKVGDATVISVQGALQRLLGSEWYKTRKQQPPLAKNDVRRVADAVDIAFTAAEVELLEWARRVSRARDQRVHEGWYQESVVRHPLASGAGYKPFLDGIVDHDDVALALAFQSMEREGSALFPREVLCRIFCAASPTYRLTCGRWTEITAGTRPAGPTASFPASARA